jgi:hypothetical protein
MANTIRRNLALHEYDVKSLPSGASVVFSIGFVKKNGEVAFIPSAIASGLPFSVSGNRMRGVMPVDGSLARCGHIIAVDIDAIVSWNGKRVIL